MKKFVSSLVVVALGIAACGSSDTAEPSTANEQSEVEAAADGGEERAEAIAEMTSAGLTFDQAACTYDFVAEEFGTDFAKDFNLENQTTEDAEAIVAIVAQCINATTDESTN